MNNQAHKLEQKIKDSFIAYFDRQPINIKIDGEYANVDGFYCRILNNKTIRTRRGITWKKDLF
jgi:Tfp pilus assembly protein PilO